MSLMEQYECDTLLLPAGPVWRGLLKGVIAEKSTKVVDVPEMDAFLDIEDTSPSHGP